MSSAPSPAAPGCRPESSGHFTTSGSEANYTALICALTRAEPRFGSEGVRAFPAPVAMYTSRGVPARPGSRSRTRPASAAQALRLVATDGQRAHGRGARCAGSWSQRPCRAAHVPVLIAATAGTTGGGHDRSAAAPARASRASTASGTTSMPPGAARRCAPSACEALLAGIELADSHHHRCAQMVRDHHGLRHVHHAHPSMLSEAFRVAADFMPSSASHTRSLSQHACSGRAASSVCGCSCRWRPPAGQGYGAARGARRGGRSRSVGERLASARLAGRQ